MRVVLKDGLQGHVAIHVLRQDEVTVIQGGGDSGEKGPELGEPPRGEVEHAAGQDHQHVVHVGLEPRNLVRPEGRLIK